MKRRLCLSMQCKYLHSSNEHLSSTRCDANLKLPLENICNFVAKKQKESKGETRRREERNTSIFYTFAVRHSLRFPPLPGCGFDKKLKHFAVSPNVSSSRLGAAHTQTAREAGPNQAANLGHRVLFMCVMPWKTSPFQSSHTTHTHTYTHRRTHMCFHFGPRPLSGSCCLRCLHCLRLASAPSIISVMSFQLVVLASFAGCVVLL